MPTASACQDGGRLRSNSGVELTIWIQSASVNSVSSLAALSARAVAGAARQAEDELALPVDARRALPLLVLDHHEACVVQGYRQARFADDVLQALEVDEKGLDANHSMEKIVEIRRTVGGE